MTGAGAHDGHGHGRGLDRDLVSHRAAIRAIWVSVVALATTAVAQLAIVAISDSSGLLADALHNVGDVAGTAVLWVGFTLSRRRADDRFTYGWHRAEDLAGIAIVLAIVVSAVLAGVDSVRALLGDGHDVRNAGAALVAALVGAAGNEAVAVYKIRVGERIDSAPLRADGQHARVDGLVSLAAAVGIGGAWLGFPWMDAAAGLGITAAIGWILWRTGAEVFVRNLDGVDPGTVPRLRELSASVDGVRAVHDVRARYVGRNLLVHLHACVDGSMSLADAHEIAEEVRRTVADGFATVIDVDVHLDPVGHDGSHPAVHGVSGPGEQA